MGRQRRFPCHRVYWMDSSWRRRRLSAIFLETISIYTVNIHKIGKRVRRAHTFLHRVSHLATTLEHWAYIQIHMEIFAYNSHSIERPLPAGELNVKYLYNCATHVHVIIIVLPSRSSDSSDRDGLVSHVNLPWLRTLSAAKFRLAQTTSHRSTGAHNTIVIGRPSWADARPLKMTFILLMTNDLRTHWRTVCAHVRRAAARSSWMAPANANAIIYFFFSLW